jgi:hypothetical protein
VSCMWFPSGLIRRTPRVSCIHALQVSNLEQWKKFCNCRDIVNFCHCPYWKTNVCWEISLSPYCVPLNFSSWVTASTDYPHGKVQPLSKRVPHFSTLSMVGVLVGGSGNIVPLILIVPSIVIYNHVNHEWVESESIFLMPATTNIFISIIKSVTQMYIH